MLQLLASFPFRNHTSQQKTTNGIELLDAKNTIGYSETAGSRSNRDYLLGQTLLIGMRP
jgi:hypothetical protein